MNNKDIDVYKRLILHAGMPKTGTTTIQNTLYKCRDVLLAQNKCLYPSIAANHTNSICTIFMNHPERHIANRMAGLAPGDEPARLQASYREALRKDMDTDNWDLCVISAEGVSNLNHDELGKIRDWFQNYCSTARVLFYVRNPVDYTRSVIQQLLKGGEKLGDLYKNLPVPNFKGKISNAIQAFGRENVEIIDFHAASNSDGGLLGSFSDLLRFPPTIRKELLDREVRENESMSFSAAHILDYINTKTPVFVDGKLSVLRTGLEQSMAQRIGGKKFDIPVVVQRLCYESTRDDVAWLNETFGTNLFQNDFVERGKDVVPVSDFIDALHKIATVMSEQLGAIAAMKACNEGIKALGRRDFGMADALLERASGLAPSDRYVSEFRLRLEAAKQKAQEAN